MQNALKLGLRLNSDRGGARKCFETTGDSRVTIVCSDNISAISEYGITLRRRSLSPTRCGLLQPHWPLSSDTSVFMRRSNVTWSSAGNTSITVVRAVVTLERPTGEASRFSPSLCSQAQISGLCHGSRFSILCMSWRAWTPNDVYWSTAQIRLNNNPFISQRQSYSVGVSHHVELGHFRSSVRGPQLHAYQSGSWTYQTAICHAAHRQFPRPSIPM
ncbi:hypothetical protein K491DRAFT_194599 [Lophiostoma macrostomum CBS 122681]|uniref:Uncharacterized protein n=1 Tax=Lophiostoma macrostomum CBS 122681 TaxID=1314788 RepID=A0A6A6TJ13_9PLEO|nr:hypothetical protein K491DRAFT_194599 [Lophiostoma macrostomum CBS 122681]